MVQNLLILIYNLLIFCTFKKMQDKQNKEDRESDDQCIIQPENPELEAQQYKEYKSFFNNCNVPTIEVLKQQLSQEGLQYSQNISDQFQYLLISNQNDGSALFNIEYGHIRAKISVLFIQIKLMHFKRKMVGNGNFSQVYQFIYNNQKVAAKQVHINNLYKNLQTILGEVFILKVASALKIGPKFLFLYGYDIIIFDKCAEFLMEKCQKIDHEKKSEQFTIKKGLKNDLAILHKLHLIHCDIKPQNIAWSSSYKKSVFIDFGLSKFIKQNSNQTSKSRFRGSFNYTNKQMKKAYFERQPISINLYHNDSYALERSFKTLILKKNTKQQQFKQNFFIDSDESFDLIEELSWQQKSENSSQDSINFQEWSLVIPIFYFKYLLFTYNQGQTIQIHWYINQNKQYRKVFKKIVYEQSLRSILEENKKIYNLIYKQICNLTCNEPIASKSFITYLEQQFFRIYNQSNEFTFGLQSKQIKDSLRPQLYQNLWQYPHFIEALFQIIITATIDKNLDLKQSQAHQILNHLCQKINVDDGRNKFCLLLAKFREYFFVKKNLNNLQIIATMFIERLNIQQYYQTYKLIFQLLKTYPNLLNDLQPFNLVFNSKGHKKDLKQTIKTQSYRQQNSQQTHFNYFSQKFEQKSNKISQKPDKIREMSNSLQLLSIKKDNNAFLQFQQKMPTPKSAKGHDQFEKQLYQNSLKLNIKNYYQQQQFPLIISHIHYRIRKTDLNNKIQLSVMKQYFFFIRIIISNNLLLKNKESQFLYLKPYKFSTTVQFGIFNILELSSKFLNCCNLSETGSSYGHSFRLRIFIKNKNIKQLEQLIENSFNQLFCTYVKESINNLIMYNKDLLEAIKLSERVAGIVKNLFKGLDFQSYLQANKHYYLKIYFILSGFIQVFKFFIVMDLQNSYKILIVAQVLQRVMHALTKIQQIIANSTSYSIQLLQTFLDTITLVWQYIKIPSKHQNILKVIQNIFVFQAFRKKIYIMQLLSYIFQYIKPEQSSLKLQMTQKLDQIYSSLTTYQQKVNFISIARYGKILMYQSFQNMVHCKKPETCFQFLSILGQIYSKKVFQKKTQIFLEDKYLPFIVFANYAKEQFIIDIFSKVQKHLITFLDVQKNNYLSIFVCQIYRRIEKQRPDFLRQTQKIRLLKIIIFGLYKIQTCQQYLKKRYISLVMQKYRRLIGFKNKRKRHINFRKQCQSSNCWQLLIKLFKLQESLWKKYTMNTRQIKQKFIQTIAKVKSNSDEQIL